MYPAMPFIKAAEGHKIPAAWLIEHVALMKGTRSGDVGTWPTQPLAIVNYGSATADEIDAFAAEIKKRVHEKTGIMLEQEVNRVG
jgi:UDP-N-acetylmuramate dehydrogenase